MQFSLFLYFRRLSASALSPVTGVQVHSQNKIAMNTIAETPNRESEHEEEGSQAVASFPTPAVKNSDQQRLSSGSGSSTADETSQMISYKPSGTQTASEDALKNSEGLLHKKGIDNVPLPNIAENTKILPVKRDPIHDQETRSHAATNPEDQSELDEDLQNTGSSDAEPITINGEIPQLADNGASSEATILTVDGTASPVGDSSSTDNAISSDSSISLSTKLEDSNSVDKKEEESVSDEYRDNQTLSLYDYDEKPVDV